MTSLSQVRRARPSLAARMRCGLRAGSAWAVPLLGAALDAAERNDEEDHDGQAENGPAKVGNDSSVTSGPKRERR